MELAFWSAQIVRYTSAIRYGTNSISMNDFRLFFPFVFVSFLQNGVRWIIDRAGFSCRTRCVFALHCNSVDLLNYSPRCLNQANKRREQQKITNKLNGRFYVILILIQRLEQSILNENETK